MAFKMKCTYEFVVENDKCVVCYATPIWVDKTTRSIQAIATHVEAYTNMPQKDFPLGKRFKGVAVRKAGDEINIQLAKKIARKKAMRAAIRAFGEYIRRCDEVIGDYWSRISWAELAVDKKFFDIDYEIEDLASDYDSEEEEAAEDYDNELED